MPRRRLHRTLLRRSILLILSLATGARAQTATFAGRILADPDEHPLANVEISLPQLKKSARTDSTGAFRITGIEAGERAIVARLAGFELLTAALTFAPGQVLEADLVMNPVVAKLPAVEVKDKSTDVRLTDFEDRRKEGIGRFFDMAYLEKNQDRQFAQLLAGSVPGLRVVSTMNEQFMASNRSIGGGPCLVQVIVNGVILFNGNEGIPRYDISILDTKDVLGVEYYTPGETPLRYRQTGGRNERGTAGGATCGTLIIWTK